MLSPRITQILLLGVALAAFLPLAAAADVADEGEILVPVACVGDPSQVVGRVVAHSGSVKAQRAGAAPRPLSCNDVIHACETVVTASGARVGLMAGDVYAHLEEDSRLEIGSAGSQPSLSLLAGAVRVIDPSTGAGIPLSTPHLRTTIRATDTELWVGGADTRLCNHEAELDVAARGGGEPLALRAACAVSAGNAVAAAAGVGPSIDVQDAPTCEVQMAGFFSPSDVALPLGFAFPSSGAADVFRRDACEASGCPVNVAPVPPTPVPPRTSPPRATPPRIITDPDGDGGCGGPGFGCGEERSFGPQRD